MRGARRRRLRHRGLKLEHARPAHRTGHDERADRRVQPDAEGRPLGRNPRRRRAQLRVDERRVYEEHARFGNLAGARRHVECLFGPGPGGGGVEYASELGGCDFRAAGGAGRG